MSTIEDLRPAGETEREHIEAVLSQNAKFAARGPTGSGVSKAECARMHELDETLSHAEIGDRLGWSRHTVDDHIRDRCSHDHEDD